MIDCCTSTLLGPTGRQQCFAAVQPLSENIHVPFLFETPYAFFRPGPMSFVRGAKKPNLAA